MEKKEERKSIKKEIIDFLGKYAILVGVLAFLVAMGMSVFALIKVSGWELWLLALSVFIIALGGFINMIGGFWASKKHEELEREKLNNQAGQINIQKQGLDNQAEQIKELERANRLQEQANKQNEEKIELLKKQMKRDRVIAALKAINSLKSDFEVKTRRIDGCLRGELFAQNDLLIRPDYKYVHVDILGKKNCDKIKEEVDRYNTLVKAEQLEEAKGIGDELKNKLEEMKSKHVEEFGIAEEEIEKEKGKVMTAIK